MRSRMEAFSRSAEFRGMPIRPTMVLFGGNAHDMRLAASLLTVHLRCRMQE